MLEQEFYVRAKLDDLRRGLVIAERRRQAADPGAEVERTGVGVRHEVFRRMVGDPAPRRRPFWRRFLIAS